MVLYKRKQVKFEPVPKFVDDNTEVWGIEETGEVFVDYEKFLNRRDFYEQRKFTCESTGRTGYTYFEAKLSETEASTEINSILPEALRSRVLHFVQFQITSRMDDLVNDVYDHFKEQFMVNDRVSIEGEPSRQYGTIIDMSDNSRLHSMFAGQHMDDSARSFTYIIQLDDTDERVTKYKSSELQRDRKVYSKLILKQFLRHTTGREKWIGSPWMVKEHLAKRYSIPTKMPDKKTREAMALKRAANGVLANGTHSPTQQNYQHHAHNGHAHQTNGHHPQAEGRRQRQQTFVNWTAPNGEQYPVEVLQPHQVPPHMRPPPPGPPQPHPAFSGGIYPPYMIHHAGPPAQFIPTSHGLPPHLNPAMHPIPPHLAQLVQNPLALQVAMHPPQFQTSFVHNQQSSQQSHSQSNQTPQLSRPFEPVKYPMEDLDIKEPRKKPVRPPLKFFSDDVPEGVEEPSEEQKTGIAMNSVGPLLCAWETLNVHDVIYSLDSFTFDDFVDAMRFTSEEIECELFVEIHCAILKQIVNSSGKLQTPLPKQAEVEETDDEGSSKESTPEPEPEPPVRTTRSSLRKSELQQIVKARTPTPEPPKALHSAEKFDAEFDWMEQCKIRNFREGGWQAIVVALLYRLSFDPLQKDACDEVLAQLVPPNEEPTIESIASNYIELDVNLRISALDMILRLTVATEAFREQLIAAGLEMTRLRKEKIDHQRKRKELADELFKLDLDRKINLPENTPASPTDTKQNDDIDTSMASFTSEGKETAEADDSLDEPAASKARLRHTNKNKRKAAAEEARKEKAKKAKAEAEKTKKQKLWEKLLRAIDDKKDEVRVCEAAINELDDDLRETLVHRSKMLGKDRFMNKYYWFEHNGMPFGGVPNSSTAEYGYANGRIWVQGPDEYELQPVMEEPALSQDKKRFGFTMPERKEVEEGKTHLSKSTEWAYYDDPEEIDQLLAWLDERGVREKALRKELQAYRERIAEYMVIMKKHLNQNEKAEDEEEDEEPVTTAVRISTRKKTYIDKETTKDRCLLWTNSIMREENGFNHSEEYEPPRKARAKPTKAPKGKGRR